ncbi:hypothetical protein KKC88_01000 [Patescibacteria group bacterium]|nr:hypothetical protein [Patescibacteria group bacterium]MBU1673337.1 hypothetical protein [Patescibacteria group bacterium]MBU1963544.1 hypothetical protein [Patescibacteria group bacterium]
MPERKIENQDTNISKKLQQQIQAEFLQVLENNPGLHLPDIAKLLGAEEYLVQTEAKKKGGVPGIRFDITSYIKERVKQGKLEAIRLPQHIEQINEVIIPPDEKEIITGSGAGWEKPKFIPRTEYLMELLSELETDYDVVIGTNTPEMMRGESYQVFLLLDFNKIVFVNNEEGNATFIIHHLEPEDSWEDYSDLTKDQLKQFTESGLVTRIIFQGDSEEWKIKIEELILKPFEQRVNNEYAPKGWKTNYNLVKLLDSVTSRIERITNKYRTDHPEWFKNYKLKSGPAREHFAPELVKLIIKEIEEEIPPPQGWLTNRQTAEKIGITHRTAKKWADKLREGNSDWFKFYFFRGKNIEFYAPELITKLKEQKEGLSNVEEGWIHNYELSKSLGVDHSVTRQKAEKYRAEHPEWFRKIGRSIYYAPKLIQILIDEIGNWQEIPAGWLSRTAVAKKFGRSRKITDPIAKKYLKEHLGWHRQYGGYTYYSPELINHIQKDLKSYEMPPENWITLNSLIEKFNTSSFLINKYMDSLKLEYEEEIGKFKLHGQEADYISPKLAKKLEEMILEARAVPEGWIAREVLVQEYNTTRTTISRIAKEFLDQNPEWQKKFRLEYKKKELFYSPELVSKIRKAMEKRISPPDGWMTARELSRELPVSSTTLKKYAYKYKSQHPEWFHKYQIESRQMREHYSPELVAKIKENLEK